MPTAALLLALAAAALHAFWNLVLARARDTEAATAAMFGVAAVAWAPLAVWTWDVERAAVPYIAASAAFELAYLALLAAAYRRAQLSVVYPVARGLAPVLVLVAGVLVLDAETSAAEVGGIALVALGILLVRGFRRGAETTGVLFGVAIAACIAAYTLVDSRGVRHAHPIPYLELVMLGPSLAYLGAVVAAKGTAAVRRELRLPIVLAGVATFGAFALALAALRLASAASVAAVRETSVVIAVALAAPVLKESVGAARLAGAALVVAGVAVLGFG